MDWNKIKRKYLEFMIRFTLSWASLKLAQEGIDIANNKQLVEYESIIDDFVQTMKSQGIEEPVEIFDYYNYALWNGYLSDEHKYQYNGARDLFLSNPGLSCVTGDGVCLNKADFLTSIYKDFGYDAYTLNCYVDVDKGIAVEPIRSNTLFERTIAKNSATNNLDLLMDVLKPITILFGNHAITCVEFEGEFYYVDPTNLAYLEKVDLNTMKIINGEGNFEIRYFISAFYWNLGVLGTLYEDGFDYSELLNNDQINIDIQKLEQFYNDNCDKYKSINEKLQEKNQLVLYIIISYIVSLGLDVCKNKIRQNYPKIKRYAKNNFEKKD